MILFYSEEIDLSSKSATLSDQEAVHASKALRKSAGDVIHITDGHGTLYSGVVTSASKNEVHVDQLEIVEKQQSGVKTAIAIAPTKNNTRIEVFLEKATEIGIREIFFLESAQSEKVRTKMERYNRIVLSAMKQSLNLFLPVLHEIQSFDSFVKECSYEEKFIAHCKNPENHILNLYDGDRSAICLIGPEGDFTQDEIEIALDSGFKETNLGTSRLRTETAGVVAATLIHTAIQLKD